MSKIFIIVVFLQLITQVYNSRIGDNVDFCKQSILINSANVEKIRNCEFFEGAIIITNATFKTMHPNRLDALRSIKKITGSLIITAQHALFTSLSFLENLKSIVSLNNRSSTNQICVLIEKTSLKSIELPALEEIKCIFAIQQNKELCYADHLKEMTKVRKYNKYVDKSIITNNKNEALCECHTQCEGKCWGPELYQCYDCKYRKNCISCNDECKDGCTGPGSHECNSCRNVQDGQNCMATCPRDKYADRLNCISCNDQCKDGCTGPGSHECNNCTNVLDGIHCKSSCADNKFNFGGVCTNCDAFRDGNDCVQTCSITKYPNNGECTPCHKACVDGCSGSKATYGLGGCNNCNKMIITPNGTIVCLPSEEICPGEYIGSTITAESGRLKIFKDKIRCVPQQRAHISKISAIVGSILSIIILIAIAICFAYRKNILTKWRKSEEIEMQEQFKCQDLNPLLSQLRIITDSEICKAKVLGNGAFGTVYEATWKPDGISNNIPVAIKVMHGNSTEKTTKEFLDEAVIMAAMDHPNIVHLIAVCVSTEIMLVIPLMPLGCLLTYVRSNKHDISPKTLLIWNTQIARGMAYLEEKYLVHRDLAARNVLLETVDCVKITDFGLSKFVGAIELGASDTKFPTKWLALESLEERVFTHKSDVWSFGVTVWELLTFGERPYDKINGRELSKHLKRGLRLKQPPTCNADVYVILIRCWLMKPELRPDFKELESTFMKMSYEPSKYLTSYGIKGHFMQLNDAAQLITMGAYKKTDVYTNTMRKSVIRSAPVHSRYQTKSAELHYKKKTQAVQEVQNVEVKNSRLADSVSYEQECYLKPTSQTVDSDSIFEL